MTEDAGTDSTHADTPQSSAQQKERLAVEQDASWGGIIPITLLNALLNIVTLSLWRFWGRTRVRRYLWSTTRIGGLPLEYTGTGFELFRSFVFVMLAIILPIYAAIFAAQLLLPPEQFAIYFSLAYLPILLLFLWLFGAAVWIARRYRLSRTSWRGIRFAQIGSLSNYAWASIGYSLLSSITLGWFEPIKEMRLTRMLWRDTYFGDTAFSVPESEDGLSRGLYGRYALYWFSFILAYAVFIAVLFAIMFRFTDGGEVEPEMSVEMIIGVYLALIPMLAIIGLFSIPYQAALIRRKAEIVSFQDVSFSIKARSLSFGWIAVGNFLIILLSLGLATPIAQMRLWRYIFRRLEINGQVDLDRIAQNPQRGPGSGEGLADAFDIGNVI